MERHWTPDPSATLPSRDFQPRVYGVGAWTDHLAFACDVIACLRPQLFVELGTDRGESYFAFCQAVAEQRTGTRCFAVDTWQGDAQAGGYDETTWNEVSAHRAAHYRDFATLMRTSFDDAAPEFAEESIDLLHLDGLHTEAAVRHDLETWLPKLRPGGLLLMHDVSVRDRGFGVWKVWGELIREGRSFVFPDGPGLGVWQKPPVKTRDEPLETLLGGAEGESLALLDYYRAQALRTQRRIQQDWADGSIARTVAGRQTIVQVFHTRDGVHRECDAVVARIGHDGRRQIDMALPPHAGAAPLRIDFLSAFTVIDIYRIDLRNGDSSVFCANTAPEFAAIRVEGDAERLPCSTHLRVRVTGIDPQLYLPHLSIPRDHEGLRLRMDLQVSELRR